jgi:uncharacterized protein (DUF4415 family)
MKKKPTKGKIVKFTLDLSKPQKLGAKTKARLDALEDHDIDTSDIPDQAGMTGWYSPVLRAQEAKAQVTLRLDQDVLAFFKEQGPRYQTRINAVLRQYVAAHTSRR